MQEWHSGSFLCRWWPTSSRTHHCCGSVLSAFYGALQLDAGPHSASSMLWQFSLRRLL
jgi:hypothetical protein